MSGDAGRRPLSVAATNATGESVCRQPEPSLRARFHQPPPPRSSRQMPTIVVASIASVVSHTALRAPVNDRCTRYGCLADGSTGRITRRPSAICQRAAEPWEFIEAALVGQRRPADTLDENVCQPVPAARFDNRA